MLRVLAKVGNGWLKFAEIMGNIQMIILLSLIYWTMVFFLALPFRFLADPLALRRPGRSRWISRDPISNVMDSMRRQG